MSEVHIEERSSPIKVPAAKPAPAKADAKGKTK